MGRPVRSPEIAELRAFCTAVDLGSFGRAARLLRVSQPALSKRLRTFEGLIGARLLDRSPRGVSPTPAGSRLYVEARKLLTQLESVEAVITGLATDGAPIRLAASHTMAEFVLPGPLLEFEKAQEHKLSVELFIANSNVIRRLVRDGRAELGLAAVDPSRGRDRVLEEHPFCEDEVVVVVPERHPWANADEIDLEAFVGTPMITRDPEANTRRVVEAALAERGLSLAPALAQVGSTSAAIATALAESAPALLSRLAVGGAGEALVGRRVRGVRFPRRFVLVFGSERALTSGARALVDHLLQSRPTVEALDEDVLGES